MKGNKLPTRFDKFSWLVLVFFVLLLLSRVLFLTSDSFRSGFDVEEKCVGYNARNKVLFDNWESGGDYQPMAFNPLSNLISYLSFSSLGVGLFSLRIPYALLSILGFVLYYLVLKKEFNRYFSFLGTMFLSSITYIAAMNRTAICENLFLFLTIATLFFYQKGLKYYKYFFGVGLFSFLTLVAKLNGAIFTLATFAAVSFFIFRKKGERKKIFPPFFAGIALGLLIWVVSLLPFHQVGYFPTLKWLILANTQLIDIYQSDVSVQVLNSFRAVINSIQSNFRLTPMVINGTLPYTTLLGLTSIWVIFYYCKRISELDKFSILWLIVGILFINLFCLNEKRLVLIIPAMVYLIVKTFTLLWNNRNNKGFIHPQAVAVLFIGFLLIFSSWLWRFSQHNIHNTIFPLPGRNTILFLSLFIGICLALLFNRIRNPMKYCYLRKLAVRLYSFSFLFAIVISNYHNIDNFFLSRQNMSFQASRDLGRILEPTTIVGTELAYRFLGFENCHKFIFKHDGGKHNINKDIAHILERDDIRYFCLNMDRNKRLDDPNIKKMLSYYPKAKLLKIYKCGRFSFALFDKGLVAMDKQAPEVKKLEERIN
ncbi:MAG: glycosyltransferase family 39 protein [bacterium]